MTGYIPIPLMAVWAVYGFLAHMQALHVQHFAGRSRNAFLVLMLFNFFALIFGLCFLIYAGFALAWWVPFALVAIGMVGAIPLGFVEDLVGTVQLSLLGFILLPVCAALMVYFLP